MNLNQIYVAEKSIPEGSPPIISVFIPVEGPLTDPHGQKYMDCRVLTSSIPRDEDEICRAYFYDSHRIRPISRKDLPLFIGLAWTSKEFERMLKCPSSSNPTAPQKYSPTT